MITPAGISGILHHTHIAFPNRSGTLPVGFTRHRIAMNRVERRRNLRQLFTLLHERPPEGAGHLARSARRASAITYAAAAILTTAPVTLESARYPISACPANQSRKVIPYTSATRPPPDKGKADSSCSFIFHSPHPCDAIHPHYPSDTPSQEGRHEKIV